MASLTPNRSEKFLCRFYRCPAIAFQFRGQVKHCSFCSTLGDESRRRSQGRFLPSLLCFFFPSFLQVPFDSELFFQSKKSNRFLGCQDQMRTGKMGNADPGTPILDKSGQRFLTGIPLEHMITCRSLIEPSIFLLVSIREPKRVQQR